jgi:pyrimidine operon attenuation protein/uracil phosphoribosyltransferase
MDYNKDREDIILMDAARIERTLRRMAFQLLESAGLSNENEQINLIGLNERGFYIASRIQAFLDEMIRNQKADHRLQTQLHQLWIKPTAASVTSPAGYHAGQAYSPVLSDTLAKLIRQSERLQQLILIDDVLFSGQSLAKAFSLLFEAAPANACPRIRTAILIDRGHRRFPLYPEVLGMRYPTKFNEQIEARVPPAYEESSVVLLAESRERNAFDRQ